jgi:hypothetical protein
MSKNREELHRILVDILGSRNVYFQPPESIKLKYPCIIYERSYIQTVKADNTKYIEIKEYTVTVIDEDPDSEIPDKLIKLPYCSFSRHFVYDNLNHDVFTLYF